MSSVTCVSGCKFAERAAASGQSEIGRLFRQRGFEFQFRAAFGQRGFEFDLGLVDEFAGSRTFFFGQGAELFHQRGEFPLRPDERTFACAPKSRRSCAALISASAACFSGSISFNKDMAFN